MPIKNPVGRRKESTKPNNGGGKTMANSPTTQDDTIINKNKHLEVKRSAGLVLITIGEDLLVNVIQHGPYLDQFDPEVEKIEIDSNVFVDEIIKYLQVEAEDGKTPIHHAIDVAAEDAIENGCDGIKFIEISAGNG
jgi:hypothetical protein